MYRIRFNLGRGPKYKKWKVTSPDKTYQYYDPNEISFILINAKLKNNISTSQKIFNGANKRVCAWIECENIKINYDDLKGDEIKYNPRVQPYWEKSNINIDNMEFDYLFTQKNKIYQIK